MSSSQQSYVVNEDSAKPFPNNKIITLVIEPFIMGEFDFLVVLVALFSIRFGFWHLLPNRCVLWDWSLWCSSAV